MDPPEQPPPQEPEKSQEPEKKPDDEPKGWIPRPPKTDNVADFIVVVFTLMVATVLIALTVGIIIAAIKGNDVKAYFAVLTSIMTSIISALVGYFAGKGQGGGGSGGTPAV